jgi:hypothetical protein
MPDEPRDGGRPAVIRAVHGVTASGDWFLLADVASKPPGGVDDMSDARRFDESWLVVLGRRDRDIITLQGHDA